MFYLTIQTEGSVSCYEPIESTFQLMHILLFHFRCGKTSTPLLICALCYKVILISITSLMKTVPENQVHVIL